MQVRCQGRSEREDPPPETLREMGVAEVSGGWEAGLGIITPDCDTQHFTVYQALLHTHIILFNDTVVER